MTRKDYVAIAEVISGALADIRHDAEKDFISDKGRAILSGERAGVHMVALRIADVLREDNPRFDWGRFVKACGIDL